LSEFWVWVLLKLVKQPLSPGNSQAFMAILQCQQWHILLLERAKSPPSSVSRTVVVGQNMLLAEQAGQFYHWKPE